MHPNRIREQRERAGLSAAKLGKLIGVSGTAVLRYETGEREVTLNTLEKIADALNLEVRHLIAPRKNADNWQEILIVAIVKPGKWTLNPLLSKDKQYDIEIPKRFIFDPDVKEGIEVEGHASNNKYPDGSIVLIKDVSNISRRTPKAECDYVVQRINEEGHAELSIRRLKVDKIGKFWLVAYSDDPAESPWPYNPNSPTLSLQWEVAGYFAK